MAKGGGARQDHFIQNVIVVGALRLWGKLYVEKKYLNSDRKIWDVARSEDIANIRFQNGTDRRNGIWCAIVRRIYRAWSGAIQADNWIRFNPHTRVEHQWRKTVIKHPLKSQSAVLTKQFNPIHQIHCEKPLLFDRAFLLTSANL